MAAFLVAFVSSHPASAAVAPALSAVERSELRGKLEDQFNELDLLVKNQNTDRKDLDRQQREMGELQVFDRIPIQPEIPRLTQELTRTASEHHLKIAKFQALGARSYRASIPKAIYNDQRFRLDPRATAEELPFRVVVQGSRADLDQWIASWRDDQLRLVAPELEAGKPDYRPAGRNRWQVRAHAFRFKPIRFPELKIRDPQEYLPAWAQADPDAFAKAEPFLWSFVTRARSLAPQARSLYDVRRQFLLNGARMTFYTQKTLGQ